MAFKRLTLDKKSSWTGRLFVLPFYLGFIFFFASPFIQSISFVFSKAEVNVGGIEQSFTGFDNLQHIFRIDPDYGRLLAMTVTSLLWQVPVVIIASLFIAVILKSRFLGRTFIRGVFFLPVILASGMVLSIVQGDVVAGSVLTGNVVSSGTIVSSSSLENFMVNAGFGSGIVTIISLIYNNLFGLLWKTGIQMIIFLAGLQSIPMSLYEASAVEGTTAWEDFWKITIPMIKPIIMLNIFFTIIESFMDSQNLVMRKVVSAFNAIQLGVASAMAWTYFAAAAVILIAVALVLTKISGKN